MCDKIIGLNVHGHPICLFILPKNKAPPTPLVAFKGTLANKKIISK